MYSAHVLSRISHCFARLLLKFMSTLIPIIDISAAIGCHYREFKHFRSLTISGYAECRRWQNNSASNRDTNPGCGFAGVRTAIAEFTEAISRCIQSPRRRIHGKRESNQRGCGKIFAVDMARIVEPCLRNIREHCSDRAAGISFGLLLRGQGTPRR